MFWVNSSFGSCHYIHHCLLRFVLSRVNLSLTGNFFHPFSFNCSFTGFDWVQGIKLDSFIDVDYFVDMFWREARILLYLLF
ncbi:hypothetical protein MANES_17G016075v8 [Manihot esculenta]|uniref:Uncharacterized protein n=1 Tax=Manihot esculenta TaxID=3983 RepID=A0ACB7G3Q3_MANES|nr:hypothetical protein MANES_17G016075v8 [Manihot esculenta]